MILTASGQPVTTVHPMTREQIQRFIEFERILLTCGWQLTCPNCARQFGYGKDGVQANNDPMSTTLSVRCGCSEHRFEAR